MALALIHHFGKGPAQPGLAARGSSAFLGHVDISIEMRHPGGDPLTRRRRFFSLSRWPEAPRQLVLELNADATDYVRIDETDDDFTAFVSAFQMVLQDAPQKLTRADILAEWPADFDKPSPSSLRRWLARGVERGEVACEGTGRRNDPLRYWLPATLERWRADNPLYDLFAQQERDLKLPFESLTRKRRRDGAEARREGADDDEEMD